VRGQAERAPAVQDRDRRRGHPLHSRQVATSGRHAADHHAWLAWLGHRTSRDYRLGWLCREARHARSGQSSGQAAARAAGQPPPQVSVPVGFTTFPGEIFRAPRSWVEKNYPSLTYYNEADKGGHFAAWEQPEVFATKIRAAFRAMR
jgi:pimeloyl-ACP methyl ester carboxylesterase